MELLRKRLVKRHELLCQIWSIRYVLELGNYNRPRRSRRLDFAVCDAVHRAGEPQAVVSYCLAVADLPASLSGTGSLPVVGQPEAVEAPSCRAAQDERTHQQNCSGDQDASGV